MIGSNSTVTIEHLTTARDAHGAKSTDGTADQTHSDLPAMIARPSLGNLWKMTVAGNFADIAKAPTEWRITDSEGNIYAPMKVTYRAPIARLGESEHTLIFMELQGEIQTEARI